MHRRGFTLIELIVAMGVVALLIGFIAPAVQAARENARRAECRSNLKQIGLALQNYDANHGMFPACGVNLVSWHVSLLPFIDQAAVYHQVDYSANEPAAAIAHVVVRPYLCVSDSAPEVFRGDIAFAATSYLGNSGAGVFARGFDGVFQHFQPVFPNQYPEGPVRLGDVTDGSSTTAAVSEVLHSVGGAPTNRLRVVWNLPASYGVNEADAFRNACMAIPPEPRIAGWKGSPIQHGWSWVQGEIGFSTYNHALAPSQPSCFNGSQVQLGIYTAASAHHGIVNTLFCDGHVQLVSPEIHRSVWEAIGTRNGSESVSP